MIKYILTFGLGATLLASLPTMSDPQSGQHAARHASETTTDSGFEMLAHGPVHEAVAEPWLGKPRPPPIVSQEPPAPISELQPEQHLRGNNVHWIGGYWAWDVGSNKFLWLRGIWRDLPPGRRWVDGHWARLADGWQRVPGFWAQYAEFQFLRPPMALAACLSQPWDFAEPAERLFQLETDLGPHW